MQARQQGKTLALKPEPGALKSYNDSLDPVVVAFQRTRLWLESQCLTLLAGLHYFPN
jgi:hypothetical protein